MSDTVRRDLEVFPKWWLAFPECPVDGDVEEFVINLLVSTRYCIIILEET